jgi:spore coat protein U-like protein
MSLIPKSVLGLVVALLCMYPSVLLAASASTSLSVTASVANTCTIGTNPLAFGAYDPVVAHASSNLDGTGTVTITCNKGAVTTVGLDLGANASGTTRRMTNGTDFLTYQIYKEAARTNIWGNSGANLLDTGTAPSKSPRSFSAFGRIPSGQDVGSGSYTDTVVATVNF